MKEDNLAIPFTKMTGAGNDFVLIDNRISRLNLEWVKLAPILCNRRYGVGADGLLVIEKHPQLSFTMNYFNADGSYGGMCGNGARCAALYEMERLNISQITFHALSYDYYVTKNSHNTFLLKMKDPTTIRANIELNYHDHKLEFYAVDTGSPHAVLFWDSIDSNLQDNININGIGSLGKDIRFSNYFAPAGINVNFVRIINSQTITLRTYERGVEDETLACGTGAVASAIIASLVRGVTSPVTIHTKSNEVLSVQFEKEGNRYFNIFLEGPAKIVFEGQINTSTLDNLTIPTIL